MHRTVRVPCDRWVADFQNSLDRALDLSTTLCRRSAYIDPWSFSIVLAFVYSHCVVSTKLPSRIVDWWISGVTFFVRFSEHFTGNYVVNWQLSVHRGDYPDRLCDRNHRHCNHGCQDSRRLWLIPGKNFLRFVRLSYAYYAFVWN